MTILPLTVATSTQSSVYFVMPTLGTQFNFATSYDITNVSRTSYSNPTFPEYWFLTTSTGTYAIQCQNTNITFTSFFTNQQVNFTSTGNGTVKIYSQSNIGAPISSNSEYAFSTSTSTTSISTAAGKTTVVSWIPIPDTTNEDNSTSSTTGENKVYSVTIKIQNNTKPVRSAVINIGDTYLSTDAFGKATFHLKKGTYTMEVYDGNTLNNKLFERTIVVSRTETFTFDLANIQSTTPSPTNILPIPTPNMKELDASWIPFIAIIGVGALLLLYIMSTRKKK